MLCPRLEPRTTACQADVPTTTLPRLCTVKLLSDSFSPRYVTPSWSVFTGSELMKPMSASSAIAMHLYDASLFKCLKTFTQHAFQCHTSVTLTAVLSGHVDYRSLYKRL